MGVKIWAIAAGLAAAAVAGPVFAASAGPGDAIAAAAGLGAGVTPVGLDSFANVRIDFPGGVAGYPDVPYSTIDGFRPLKLDLFLPPARFGSAGPRPLVVYVHGGGWVGGGPRRSGAFLDWPKVLASLAEQGYVVASVGYRFAGEARFPAPVQDVKSAIRWLRVNAKPYNIDTARVGLWGSSAGGHLAALAGVSCGAGALSPAPRKPAPDRPVAETQASAPEGFDEASDCVQAVATWFGIFDFQTLADQQNQPGSTDRNPLLGCAVRCTPEQLRAPSPVAYVDAKDPPFLILHGTDDTTVPIAQSKEMVATLKAAGVSAGFVEYPGVGHSWLAPSQAATTQASRDALKRTVDFFAATIGDAARGR